MIRKLTLSVVIAAGTLTGLGLTASNADAQPPVEAHHRRFEVFVQRGHHWESRGSYRDRFEAERAARHLRHEGFRAEVREC